MKKFKNVLIVLGCGPKPDGRPSPIMLTRARKAAQLYKKNNYSKVILTGGPSRGIPESEIMKVILLKHIPQKRIITEKNSLSTVQNAVFCWEILKDKKPKNITIATSKYHLFRAKYIFRRLYKHMNVSLRFEAAKDNFNVGDFVYYHLKEVYGMFKLLVFGFC